MAESILEFQAGREAAIERKPRDRRRSADWLEGYDAVLLDHPAPPRAEKEKENECG